MTLSVVGVDDDVGMRGMSMTAERSVGAGTEKCRTQSVQLQKRQMGLFDKIALTRTILLRSVTFKDNSLSPHTWHVHRRRGRPRLQWTSTMHAGALEVARCVDRTIEALLGPDANLKTWNEAVNHYLNSTSV